MNMKLVPLLLGLGITTSLSAATERMCFGQVPIEATTDLVAKITIAENEYFTTNKCKKYFSYYEKHVDFSKEDCAINSEQLSLDKGYAPFPVFLRGTDSTGKDNIASYDWEIKDLATNTIITSSNGFNAAHIFEQAGKYSATLTITGKDGTSSTETKNITVWARDGKDYFVDSAIGDDRYNGLAQEPDSNCDANTASIGSCTGPWKTATRAFGEMRPYNVTNYPNGEYTADNICASTETADIVRYKQGNFKIFRSSTFLESAALKDKEGNYLPTLPTKLCSTMVSKRITALRPGDQVLFNRGQQFNLETAVNIIKKYTTTSNEITYNYEKLITSAIAAPGHWNKAIGVHFGAYGSGTTSPNIKNTGPQSYAALHLKGVGMFGFAMSNLSFDLNSSIPNPLGTRATFVQINANPINTSFNNITVKEMNQGLLVSATTQSQGLFLFNSNFYDSKVTQFFVNRSFNNVAIVNNTLDYSSNHLIYSSISHGLVANNTLSRPAFGRTALRFSGGDFSHPNNYIWVADNKISGWIDPRTSAEFGRAFNNGTRYNFSLINISPNNGREKDVAFHDIVFTNNIVSDAENLLNIGAGENIAIHHNTFQSPSARATPFINAARSGFRPLRNLNISNNKFIDTASMQDVKTDVTSFIHFGNYSKTKCTDQFNHKNLTVADNTFYTLNNHRRILDFYTLEQGKDLSGIDLPNLTLDQAEKYLTEELTMSNNQFFSVDDQAPIIQIGGDIFSFENNDATDIDWSQYFQDSGSLYRLYNSLSQFTQQITGGMVLASTDTISIDTLLAASYGITEPVKEPVPELTWDDVIAYAEENNITPAELEVIILNHVLASNPTYSTPGTGYSSDLPVFDAIGQWFSSIPPSIASVFSPEEAKWNDAKQLATTNKVSNNAVMVSMAK